MDVIALSGLTFFGRHGVNPEETELGQRFGVDLSLELDLTKASESDELDDTVSYSAIYKLIKQEVEGEPSMLLEHLAGRIARTTLSFDTRIRRVHVKIIKLNPPLKGSTTGQVSVSLTRSRTDT